MLGRLTCTYIGEVTGVRTSVYILLCCLCAHLVMIWSLFHLSKPS